MKTMRKRTIDQLRPFLNDDEAFGRLLADVHDLRDFCARFLRATEADADKALSPDELETLAVELDVEIDHGLFHLQSLKREVAGSLVRLGRLDDAVGRRAKVEAERA